MNNMSDYKTELSTHILNVLDPTVIIFPVIGPIRACESYSSYREDLRAALLALLRPWGLTVDEIVFAQQMTI